LVDGRHELVVALNGAFPVEAERVKAALRESGGEIRFVAWQTPAPCDGRAGGERERVARALRQQFFESLGADIVHTPSVFEGFGDNASTAILPAEARNYVESATLHDLIPLVHRQIYLADPLMEAWYERKLEDLRHADLLLSVSAFSREEGLELLGRTPASIVNMSSGVDVAFQPRRASNEIKRKHGIHDGMVMYAGGIDVRKNVERLIQAYAGLPEHLRNGRQLAIVCRISDYHRVLFAQIAADAGLRNDELVMTGYVSDDDLVALYSSCDVFVFPSWHEGFGLPALEAMACGAPVIASAVSSLPEVVGREDALFDPLDVDSIRKVMARALEDRAWAAELAEYGRRRASGFNWESTARTALAAFELAVANRVADSVARRSLPRLAYVSPLPPERSGISDYSAELLPALKPHYQITAITPEWKSAQVPPGIDARGVDWFAEHAADFDRIVYQFGNSTFHTHMFDLIGRYPGVAVLHDFFLSGIVAHLSYTGARTSMWDEYLYRSHGYAALKYKACQQETADSIWRYPANLPVVENALQVVVHSQYATALAAHWYGNEVAQHWRIVPQLRAAIPQAGGGVRAAARKRLGLATDAFVVCTFGMIGPSKLSSRLLDAWMQSDFAADPGAQLKFVGANQPSPYGDAMAARLGACGNASITGFVEDGQYLDYLLAADVAVQLRTLSRGETSRAALDCMAAGLPLIVNRNGSMAEIPADCALQIADEFDDQDLVEALYALADPARRAQMSDRQRAHVENELSPGLVARRYRDVIEATYASATERSLRALRCRLEDSVLGPSLPTGEICGALAFNNPGQAPRQYLVDVSELVNHDAKSGIQRVVRGVLDAFLGDHASGISVDCRVEPVYTPGDGRYYYARNFTGRLLGVTTGCADEPVDVRSGDVFLGLDLAPVDAVAAERALTDMRLAGAKIFFVVYDVLPMQRPDCFPPEAESIFRPWTEMVARIADGVACISQQVCRDFAEAADALMVQRPNPLPLWHFPLGLSLPMRNTDSLELRPELEAVRASARRMVLMVGTLEPRKGHAQALDAMELLWSQGQDVMLVIVGKQGWMVEPLIARLEAHPERGERLHWLSGVSDDELDALYAKAEAVICASEAEGYGLPLIEAACRGVPVIARDIPVFRDIARRRATFFSGTEAADLAAAIARVLETGAGSRAADATQAYDTWQDSGRRLLDIVDGHAEPALLWMPGHRRVFWAHKGQVGGEELELDRGRLRRRDGRGVAAELRAELEPGNYRLTIIDPLARPDEHPAPVVSTSGGVALHAMAGPATAHGSAVEFELKQKSESLLLALPPRGGSAIGTVILERTGSKNG